MTLTDSVYSNISDTLRTQGWSIKPLNYVIFVEPPEALKFLVSLDLDQSVLPGELVLSQVSSQNIDYSTHERLLGDSLLKYESIWKTLANR